MLDSSPCFIASSTKKKKSMNAAFSDFYWIVTQNKGGAFIKRILFKNSFSLCTFALR